MTSAIVIHETPEIEKLLKLYNEAELTIQEKSCIANIIKKIQKCKFNLVEYKYNKRICAKGDSIQYLSCNSRSYLCSDDYVDLDMSSCALNILKSLVHKYEMDQFYSVVDKLFDIKDKIDDKVKLNTFLFSQTNLEGLTKEDVYVFKKLREEIVIKNKGIYKIKNTEYNFDGTAFSHIIYYYEYLCIQSAIEFFGNNNIEYSTIVYDGIHVKEITQDQIIDLEDHIQQNTEIITKWIIKPWAEVPATFFKDSDINSTSSASEDKDDIINVVFCEFVNWANENKYIRLNKSCEILQIQEQKYNAIKVFKEANEIINAFSEYCFNKGFINYGSVDKNTEKIDKALHAFLKHQKPHKLFPVLKKDFRYIGYKNGVFDLHEQSFLTGEDIPNNMLVRKYFDEDFNPLIELPKEMLHIFKCQKWTEETINCYCALLGRLYYPINTFDDWGQIIVNLGISRTGKSTILENVIADSMEESITRSTEEGRFNIGGANDKELLFFGEAEDIHIAFKANLMKKIACGENTSMECKHVGQTSEKWNTPVAMNTNHKLKYKDNSGGLSNRFTYFKYTYIVKKDSSIKDNLVKLTPRLIPLFIKYYFDMVKTGFVKGEQVEGWSAEIDEDANDFLTWYNTPKEDLYTQIIYKEGSIVSLVEMKKNWGNYWKFALNKSGEPKTLDDNDYSHLQKNNISYDKIHICKSCGGKHIKDCCKNYTSTNRTTKKMFINCAIVKGGLHPDNKRPDNKRFNGRREIEEDVEEGDIDINYFR
jgi:hypothetical protein